MSVGMMKFEQVKWSVLATIWVLLGTLPELGHAAPQGHKRKLDESGAGLHAVRTTRPGVKQRRRTICKVDGCVKQAVSGGSCVGHGGGKRCPYSGCTKVVQTGGLCVTHGGGQRCAELGCQKFARAGGALCVAHGGGKRCEFEGCNRFAPSRGLCRTHGGGTRCKFEGCDKPAALRGLCPNHGGGKQCMSSGCFNQAQSRGLCSRHGGRKRCGIVDCPRSALAGGWCAQHGGGKRCAEASCNHLARSGGRCTKHGGGPLCVVEGCRKAVQSQGRCVAHGGVRHCQVEGCFNLAKKLGGWCRAHMPCEANATATVAAAKAVVFTASLPALSFALGENDVDMPELPCVVDRDFDLDAFLYPGETHSRMAPCSPVLEAPDTVTARAALDADTALIMESLPSLEDTEVEQTVFEFVAELDVWREPSL
ncbi:MAG: hypothetical protein OXT67_06485 [Zetaproteobacteria bacterium]|nr:hypothetical protein [Zetaproteobacteria bacterium]